ncbi:hypothetical protein BWI92_08590 [Flectobacillus sp. BAB-3569]|nr:hypothetical protein BWI92_08590 [Flectobacillus sp. BAB-3569]
MKMYSKSQKKRSCQFIMCRLFRIYRAMIMLKYFANDCKHYANLFKLLHWDTHETNGEIKGFWNRYLIMFV